MDNLLDSQVIEAMINVKMKNILRESSQNKDMFNFLSEQQQEIYQSIIVDDPQWKDGHYFYPIKYGNKQIDRRYGEFEVLSEYLFKQHPSILQKILPPKETGFEYLKSYVQENKTILNQRKEKFQIFLNDIKKQLPNNEIVDVFIQEQNNFIEYIRNIDPQIIQSQTYYERIKKLYEATIYGNNKTQPELQDQQKELQTKVIHLDQIQTTLVILYLNLEHNTKQTQVNLQNKDVQELINKIIANQEAYQNFEVINKLERLTKKITEVIEIFQNVRLDKKQFDSYDKLLDDCLNLIKNLLQEIIK